jgi:hypothetical protein
MNLKTKHKNHCNLHQKLRLLDKEILVNIEQIYNLNEEKYGTRKIR